LTVEIDVRRAVAVAHTKVKNDLVIICGKIRIYAGNDRLDIPFVPSDFDGIKFVELFNKGNQRLVKVSFYQISAAKNRLRSHKQAK